MWTSSIEMIPTLSMPITGCNLGWPFALTHFFKLYLDFNQALQKRFPPPTTLPIKPENMPYYFDPQITTPTDTPRTTPATEIQTATNNANTSHCQSLFTAMNDQNCHGLCHLAHVPVRFGKFKQVTPTDSHRTTSHEIPAYAIQVLCFNWAVYSFGGGHFASIPCVIIPSM
jgi:hypothetical protein